jgi:hypothetical protein
VSIAQKFIDCFYWSPDVPKKYWAYPYIETAVSHNLVKKVDKGLTDGNFHIKAGATRAQTAELLYRAIGK